MEDMVEIRNFTHDDAEFIYRNWANNPSWDGCKFEKDLESSKKLIDEWNKKTYQSKYFEQFVILYNDEPVGMISLYEKTNEEASVGIHIQQKSRRKGIATKAYHLIEEIARRNEYSLLSAGVLENNMSSINLHIKAGFRKKSVATNTKGQKQIRFVKEI